MCTRGTFIFQVFFSFFLFEQNKNFLLDVPPSLSVKDVGGVNSDAYPGFLPVYHLNKNPQNPQEIKKKLATSPFFFCFVRKSEK